MNDEDRSRLADMAESARLIGDYIAPHTAASFAADRKTQDAVIRRIEILGEAAHKLSESAKEELTSLGIPVARIYGMRNRLAHDYLNTSAEVLWSAASQEAPRLATLLTQLLGK